MSGVSVATRTHGNVNLNDVANNFFSGSKTKAIYYSFNNQDAKKNCNFYQNEFDTGCTYVCYQKEELFQATSTLTPMMLLAFPVARLVGT
jgi:hypothetical protein